MTNPKFWLVSAVDDEPVQCKEYGSTVELAIAARELIENNESRQLYVFCFRGDRLPITMGPERHLVVTDHMPSLYPLFARAGETPEVGENDGLVCAGPSWNPDSDYKKLTTAETEPLEEDDGLLTEAENPSYEAD
jgi:hypothetical protein